MIFIKIVYSRDRRKTKFITPHGIEIFKIIHTHEHLHLVVRHQQHLHLVVCRHQHQLQSEKFSNTKLKKKISEKNLTKT
ncbi:hypothetical protein BpHYR1_051656 [Brachionus plicatilis]|uniref:Uncharacterized protein n=1 Tax=Brachionus plicatilis TaxID=10195 RepID=A0A3M7PZY3_BRAPC|nr:hypothetical protein BpHYR1_051656 [Brachionus plicatilis]